MTDPDKINCPLCNQPATRTLLGMDDLCKFEGCYCGTFLVERCDYDDFLGRERGIDVQRRARLSALIRESQIKGHRPIFIQFCQDRPYTSVPNAAPRYYKEFLRSEWPRTVPLRLDRTLCNLGRMSPKAGHPCSPLSRNPAIAFAEDTQEAGWNERCLAVEEFIEYCHPDQIALTLEGWRRFQELTEGRSSTENPVFVAMWFGDEGTRETMNALYHNGISPAITKVGYDAKRSDTEEHIDFVMDEIFGSIRTAPFVVADFTGNRNGVYLEAGFARGLGLPVIHTCHEDHFDQAHFDIQQVNTILWTSEQDLKEKLYHRIMATVGQGPFVDREGVPIVAP